jgi:YesN/AraC family two-component response regulator
MNKKLRLLIVDDEAITRQGIVALLEFAPDIEVIYEAANGREAVQFVAAEQPDVVLMDVRMPVMDGLVATRRIKAQWPHVKVIILTMFLSGEAEALAAGADHFMVKGDASHSLTEVILSVAASGEKGIA